MLGRDQVAWTSLGVILGGLLWIAFGVFEMLTPFGIAQVFQPALGYEMVLDVALFRLYHLPGAVALVLCALGLLRLPASAEYLSAFASRLSRFALYLTLGLGGLALAGILLSLAPLTVAGLSFGRLMLGAALVSVGVTLLRRERGAAWGWGLTLLGALGLVLLPLQPLVWAFLILPPVVAAGIMALFGVGLVLLGIALRSSTGRAAALRPNVDTYPQRTRFQR